MIIIMLVNISEIAGFCGSGDQNPAKPFRVIVIIGDQWQDPMSYLVTSPEPLDEYSGYYRGPEVPGPILGLGHRLVGRGQTPPLRRAESGG